MYKLAAQLLPATADPAPPLKTQQKAAPVAVLGIPQTWAGFPAQSSSSTWPIMEQLQAGALDMATFIAHNLLHGRGHVHQDDILLAGGDAGRDQQRNYSYECSAAAAPVRRVVLGPAAAFRVCAAALLPARLLASQTVLRAALELAGVEELPWLIQHISGGNPHNHVDRC